MDVASAEEHVLLHIGNGDEAEVLIRTERFHYPLGEGFVGATGAVTAWPSLFGLTARRARFRCDIAKEGDVVGDDAKVFVFTLGVASDALFDASTDLDHVAEVDDLFDAVRGLPETVQLDLVGHAGTTGGGHLDLHEDPLTIAGAIRTIGNTTHQQDNVHAPIVTDSQPDVLAKRVREGEFFDALFREKILVRSRDR